MEPLQSLPQGLPATQMPPGVGLTFCGCYSRKKCMPLLQACSRPESRQVRWARKAATCEVKAGRRPWTSAPPPCTRTCSAPRRCVLGSGPFSHHTACSLKPYMDLQAVPAWEASRLNGQPGARIAPSPRSLSPPNARLLQDMMAQFQQGQASDDFAISREPASESA